MPPILVTGGSGQLATALARQTQVPIRHAGRPEFDYDNPQTIEAVFKATSPWLVVNAAAYTAVDAAETDEDAAYRANRDGPALLARLCAEAGASLIHISTDYVFDGAKGTPYIETDPVSPQGVYGASKLAGEQAVLASGARAIILRTSWVYSPWGRNFVRTMLTLGQTRDRLTVVSDQKGCPTTAGDLSDAILAIVARLRDGWRDAYAGVYHTAGSGWTTWHGLAVAAFEEAAQHNRRVPIIDPITTADWPTPAKRPADSRLDCTRLAQVFGIRLPDWRPSLGPVVDAILHSER